ncbi:MAG: AzlD domain-containing protein [Janthinobacterium lividum]
MTNSSSIVVTIVAMSLLTVLTRAFFLFGGKRAALPPRVQRALRYAPAAAVTAVIFQAVVSPEGHLCLCLANHRLPAAAASLLWFLWRRRMTETIAIGMLVFTLARLWE